MGTLSLPLGPSTKSSAPRLIFTPLGNGIGFFPTLDMVLNSLPQLAEHLSADAFFSRGAAGHHATRRGQNIDAEAAQDLRDFLAADVYAATGARHALDPRDHRHVARRVFEINAD